MLTFLRSLFIFASPIWCYCFCFCVWGIGNFSNSSSVDVASFEALDIAGPPVAFTARGSAFFLPDLSSRESRSYPLAFAFGLLLVGFKVVLSDIWSFSLAVSNSRDLCGGEG